MSTVSGPANADRKATVGALRRAAVWGDPVAHSLSPVIHTAAYRSLGLTNWRYDRRQVTQTTFEASLGSLESVDDEQSWLGLSLTMPLKEVALAAAGDRVSDLARSTGAANTLFRHATGQPWHADNTDVAGLVAAITGDIALDAQGQATQTNGGINVEHCVLLGAGATARSALAALHLMGAQGVLVQCRRMHEGTARVAAELGMELAVADFGVWPGTVGVTVSTVPSNVAELAARTLPSASAESRLIDVVYGSGVSPLMSRALDLGYLVVPGIEMLLHQAVDQVRLMTGLVPQVASMREALWQAVGAPGVSLRHGAARREGTP